MTNINNDSEKFMAIGRHPNMEHHPDCNCVQCIDHPSHAKPGVHVLPRRLYVVTMLENPLLWRSRYWNYHAFENMVNAAGGVLYTAEVALGVRHFEVTQPGNPRHLQLRTKDEMWRKENVLNLLIQRLPPEAEYIAWIDADVQFTRSDWAQATLQALQHYDVVQMFSFAQDLGPEDEPMTITPGFIYSYVNDRGMPHEAEFKTPPRPGSYYSYGGGLRYAHPGFCWASRRSALDNLGMLIDWAILGSGDWHMATALVGQVERSLYDGYSERYRALCEEWQARALKYVTNNPSGGVGYITGTVNHHWHGKKSQRNYDKRWKFLAESGYDPELDLKRDHQGLYQLTDRSPLLRDGIRAYNRFRDEDGSET